MKTLFFASLVAFAAGVPVGRPEVAGVLSTKLESRLESVESEVEKLEAANAKFRAEIARLNRQGDVRVKTVNRSEALIGALDIHRRFFDNEHNDARLETIRQKHPGLFAHMKQRFYSELHTLTGHRRTPRMMTDHVRGLAERTSPGAQSLNSTTRTDTVTQSLNSTVTSQENTGEDCSLLSADKAFPCALDELDGCRLPVSSDCSVAPLWNVHRAFASSKSYKDLRASATLATYSCTKFRVAEPVGLSDTECLNEPCTFDGPAFNMQLRRPSFTYSNTIPTYTLSGAMSSTKTPSGWNKMGFRFRDRHCPITGNQISGYTENGIEWINVGIASTGSTFRTACTAFLARKYFGPKFDHISTNNVNQRWKIVNDRIESFGTGGLVQAFGGNLVDHTSHLVTGYSPSSCAKMCLALWGCKTFDWRATEKECAFSRETWQNAKGAAEWTDEDEYLYKMVDKDDALAPPTEVEALLKEYFAGHFNLERLFDYVIYEFRLSHCRITDEEGIDRRRLLIEDFSSAAQDIVDRLPSHSGVYQTQYLNARGVLVAASACYEGVLSEYEDQDPDNWDGEDDPEEAGFNTKVHTCRTKTIWSDPEDDSEFRLPTFDNPSVIRANYWRPEYDPMGKDARKEFSGGVENNEALTSAVGSALDAQENCKYLGTWEELSQYENVQLDYRDGELRVASTGEVLPFANDLVTQCAVAASNDKSFKQALADVLSEQHTATKIYITVAFVAQIAASLAELAAGMVPEEFGGAALANLQFVIEHALIVADAAFGLEMLKKDALAFTLDELQTHPTDLAAAAQARADANSVALVECAPTLSLPRSPPAPSPPPPPSPPPSHMMGKKNPSVTTKCERDNNAGGGGVRCCGIASNRLDLLRNGYDDPSGWYHVPPVIDEDWPGWKINQCPASLGGEYATSFCDLTNAMTYNQARSMCTQRHGRLCTTDELASSSCAASTGCGFDSEWIWSSDSC